MSSGEWDQGRDGRRFLCVYIYPSLFKDGTNWNHCQGLVAGWQRGAIGIALGGLLWHSMLLGR